MSLLDRLRGSQRNMTSLELAREIGGGMRTTSGAVITTDTALQIAAVYTCVRVRAEAFAQVPLLTYRRLAKGRERATDHWMYRLLHDRPNPWQTSFEWRELVSTHRDLAGNHYSMMTVVRGEVRELLPINPHRVTVKQDDRWRLSYEISMPDGGKLPVPADRMLHIRGLGWDGITGISVVSYQRETLGLTTQLVKHGAKLFSNGAQIPFVMKHPGKFKDDASAKRLRAQFDERASGLDNAMKTLLLEEGMDVAKVGITAEESQFLESRKYARSEIAGMFRVPSPLVNDQDMRYANIEQLQLMFIKFGMMPSYVGAEERINRAMVPEAEIDTIYAEFAVEGLLRGDSAARAQFYKAGIQDGWMNRAEPREFENLPPGPPELEKFLEPVQTRSPGADQAPKGAAPENLLDDPESEPQRRSREARRAAAKEPV